LTAAPPGYSEGELCLNFLADGIEVFILSFTFVSGSVVGSSAQNAILISCNQGTQGAQATIGMATKALLGVCPQALLVSALEGIAAALGIPQVVSVSAANQASDSSEKHSTFAQKYDEFFESWGAPFANPGFYTLPVPFPQKPLPEIKLSHRQRARKRRALKSLVSEQASQALLPALIDGAPPLPAVKSAPQASVCLESLPGAPR
jgi:uncharacterized protein VirK/YbjX